MTEIRAGQKWVRKNAFDTITILKADLPLMSGGVVWLVQYADASVISLGAAYIESEFECVDAGLPETLNIMDPDGVMLTAGPGIVIPDNVLISVGHGESILLRPAQVQELADWLQAHINSNGGN